MSWQQLEDKQFHFWDRSRLGELRQAEVIYDWWVLDDSKKQRGLIYINKPPFFRTGEIDSWQTWDQPFRYSFELAQGSCIQSHRILFSVRPSAL